jgi:hypothetical protein
MVLEAIMSTPANVVRLTPALSRAAPPRID